MQSRILKPIVVVLAVATACSSHDASTAPSGPTVVLNPCSVAGTLTLSPAQTARVDCGNGGTTVTLVGDSASYLVVAQFAGDIGPDQFIQYHVSSGTGVAASRALLTAASLSRVMRDAVQPPANPDRALRGSRGPRAAQRAFDRTLRARAQQRFATGTWRGAFARSTAGPSRALIPAAAVAAVATSDSLRSFHVIADWTGNTYTTVGARLAYAGNDVLVYVDTLAPANGFTSDQLQAFGLYFDRTLYPIDTAAFGPPTDLDQNGHVIMLMSPVVNSLTAASSCASQGYVAGFFSEEDLGAPATDPNSNLGEIFYSVVPDPTGAVSCAHSSADVEFDVPSVFMHELQHLISYSQHVIVHGGQPEYGWLDEGLSIAAEELGSLYYEQRCPGTACRSDPSQLFPDSSQGFIASMLYDSYQYALLPDTASLTLHSDADDGFSWRGGDWLLVRWLGDHMGAGFFKKLDENTAVGVANIESASGQSFPSLFADFGLSLYTDSLPNLARTTAPAADRFVSRNVRQLWNRLFVTSSGPDIPYAYPVQVFPITADTSTAVMDPGTMSYFRLDTPARASTVTVQFSGPGGVALPADARPQLAIFRLPPGQ